MEKIEALAKRLAAFEKNLKTGKSDHPYDYREKLTYKEFAERQGIHYQTIVYYKKDGRIKVEKEGKGGNTWIVDWPSKIEWRSILEVLKIIVPDS